MRRFVLLFCLILSISVNAQSKFEPQIKVSYELGLDADANKSFGGEFIAGYRATEAFRIGVGLGIFWCEHLYTKAHYNKTINYFEKEYRETASYIPLFIDGKYNILTTGKWRPFVSANIGYAFFNAYSDYAKENSLGLYAKPSFGADCNLGKVDLTFEVGYKYQDRKFQGDGRGYSQLVVSIGCQF